MLLKIDRGRLWRRYAIAVCLIGAFITVSHIVGVRAMQGNEEAARLLNIAGRQRMLSQRVLQLYRAEEQGEASAAQSLALDQAVDLFGVSHVALRDGGDLGLSEAGAAEWRDIYTAESGAPSVDALVLQFIADVRTVRGEQRGDLAAATARLGSFERNTALLRRLDDAVGELEARSDAKRETLVQMSRISFFAALLMLVGEAVFIFLPIDRAVRRSFSDLRTTNDRLSHSEEMTKAALQAEGRIRKDTERMLQRRTDTFANLSHEIRTPVTVLKGFLDLISTRPLDPEVKRMIGLSRAATERVQALVCDILDLRKMEEGMMALQKTSFRIRDLSFRMVAFFQPKADEKDLRLTLAVHPAVPENLYTDEGRLQQILTNLLSNAIKFTDEGQVALDVSLNEAGHIVFAVTDTGPGIREDDHDRLFWRYEQGEARSADGGGTGLGLPISRDLAKLMGGTLNVRSILGAGASFHLTLPLDVADEAGDEGEEEALDARRVTARTG